MKEELLKLRRENSTLDSNAHEQEKTLSQLRTRVAVLQQELQDKEQVRGGWVSCSILIRGMASFQG